MVVWANWDDVEIIGISIVHLKSSRHCWDGYGWLFFAWLSFYVCACEAFSFMHLSHASISSSIFTTAAYIFVFKFLPHSSFKHSNLVIGPALSFAGCFKNQAVEYKIRDQGVNIKKSPAGQRWINEGLSEKVGDYLNMQLDPTSIGISWVSGF